MNYFFVSNAVENNPLISPTVGAGSLLTSNIQSVIGKLLGINKPALATQQKTNNVNSQNTFMTNYAQRAGYKLTASYTTNHPHSQSVNESFPPRKSYGVI
jgi:hypothetical protein